MKLKNLLKNVTGAELPDIDITGLSCDSRKTKPGDLFFAVKGHKLKGSAFIPQALEKGAKFIVTDDKEFQGAAVPFLPAEDIRGVMSLAASRFYPSKPASIMAVTGTNGKTSVASFVVQILSLLGRKAASIGTLGVCDAGGMIEPTDNTTPEAIFLHRTLHRLAEKGYDAAVIEATSVGIEQKRVDNIAFRAAGFTNLTRDHLDYHGTMENYANAKKRLFCELISKEGVLVLNADAEFFNEVKDCGQDVVSYGRKGRVLVLKGDTATSAGRLVKLEAFGKAYDLVVPVIGEFQVMNALCAAGLVMSCGFDMTQVISSLSRLKMPNGRMDYAGHSPNGARVYVDYAHTPDALENALTALRPHTTGKLAVLFGCGGDRDPGKREMMGAAAERLADIVYVTDDNPRSEEPEAIRQAVLKGAPAKGQNAGARDEAIRYAISRLSSGDVLLIAGKGHEDYQEIKGIKYPFDDKKIAVAAIEALK